MLFVFIGIIKHKCYNLIGDFKKYLLENKMFIFFEKLKVIKHHAKVKRRKKGTNKRYLFGVKERDRSCKKFCFLNHFQKG